MKKFIKVIVFQIGVDVLGFPLMIKTFKDCYFTMDSQYFKSYSK